MDRGGAIGGSSAGATIQGSYLARGDTKTNTIMTGDHEEGLGFLTNCAVDQHLLARNRHFDMFEILDKYPHLLGIGIDENNTAIVVHKNRFRVIGDRYVAIYDGTKWSAERGEIKPLNKGQKQFYFLANGDEYDLEKRKIVEQEDRVFISLSEAEKQALVGTYRMEDKEYEVTIFLENDTLKARESDNSRYPLNAESANRLFIPGTNIAFEVKFDKNGEGIRIDIPQGGETLIRVEE